MKLFWGEDEAGGVDLSGEARPVLPCFEWCAFWLEVPRVVFKGAAGCFFEEFEGAEADDELGVGEEVDEGLPWVSFTVREGLADAIAGVGVGEVTGGP